MSAARLALLAALFAAGCTPPITVARVPETPDASDAPDATAPDAPPPDVHVAADAPADEALVDAVDAPVHDALTSGCPATTPTEATACTLDAGTHCDYPAADPCLAGLSCACNGHWSCLHTPPAMSCDASVHD